MARILIIDDDLPMRSTLRLALEIEGHEVQEAANGVQGIRLYQEQPADLILCDIFMPEKEGLETILELKAQFPDIKIIAMTGVTYGGVKDFLPEAEQFGAVRTLKKPFTMAELAATMQEVLCTTP